MLVISFDVKSLLVKFYSLFAMLKQKKKKKNEHSLWQVATIRRALKCISRSQNLNLVVKIN